MQSTISQPNEKFISNCAAEWLLFTRFASILRISPTQKRISLSFSTRCVSDWISSLSCFSSDLSKHVSRVLLSINLCWMLAWLMESSRWCEECATSGFMVTRLSSSIFWSTVLYKSTWRCNSVLRWPCRGTRSPEGSDLRPWIPSPWTAKSWRFLFSSNTSRISGCQMPRDWTSFEHRWRSPVSWVLKPNSFTKCQIICSTGRSGRIECWSKPFRLKVMKERELFRNCHLGKLRFALPIQPPTLSHHGNALN